MKIITTLLSLFFYVSLSHAFEYRAICSGNRGKVSVSIYTDQERLFVLYNNENGAKDFPLYEGVVTKMALPVINIAIEQLSELDQKVLISWPLQACQFSPRDTLLMQCGGSAIFHYPKNTGLSSYTFITSRVTEENMDQKFEIFKIRWGIDSSDFHHSLALPFDPKQCHGKLISKSKVIL